MKSSTRSLDPKNSIQVLFKKEKRNNEVKKKKSNKKKKMLSNFWNFSAFGKSKLRLFSLWSLSNII